MWKQVFRRSQFVLTCDCRRVLTLNSHPRVEKLLSGVQRFTTTSQLHDKEINQVDVPEDADEDFDMFGADALASSKLDKKKSFSREYKVVQDENGVIGILDPSLNILLPNADTHKQHFDGIEYSMLPVAHILATPNNTFVTVTDASGLTVLAKTSGGCVGFKNAGKSSDVAAQTGGYAVGQSLRRDGIKSVRAIIRGIGAGRESSVLGLTLAGMKIISITDNTIAHTSVKPRAKPRK